MAAAVPFIIAALKTAAVGSALSMGVTALRGGNVGRAAGMGAMTGALGGVGGALGGTLGAGIGGAAGTYAGGGITSQRVSPMQAALGGVTSAVGHKLLAPKDPGAAYPGGYAPVGYADPIGAMAPTPTTPVSAGLGGTPSGAMPSGGWLGTGSRVPTVSGATSGGGLLGGISDLFKDPDLLKKIAPMLISGAGLAGTPPPQMPAFPQVPVPQEYGVASQTFQELLGGEQGAAIKQEQQAALSQLQALQYEDYLKQIRPLAADQGWLDSSYYTDLIGDFMRRQQTVASMEQSDLSQWLMGQRAGVAGQLGTLGGQMAGLSQYNLGGQYEQQMGQYGQEYSARENLKKQLAEQLYGLINPVRS